MNNKKFLRIFISFALVLFICVCAHAMPGTGHIKTWNEVFGITDPQSKQNVKKLWNTAQSVIDDYNQDYDILNKQFKWFKLDNISRHRLLFHWGFNANPATFEPLVRRVRECLNGRPDADTEGRKFFAALARIQGERNRRLINSVVDTLGVPTARGYANAIATIIHDVHILGDYSTKATSALPKISDIESDLTVGFSKLLTGGEKSKRLEYIRSEFNRAVARGRGRINSARAENLREAARECLPPILEERFGNTLREKGILIQQ